MALRFLVVVAAVLLSAAGARAEPAPGAQQFADIGDLPLAGGQVLRDCRVGYRTFGKLDAGRSNAVLLTTWFTGTTADLADLVGPGRLADSSRYFVIAVDALADGVSSSPSNSKAQPRMRFPRITIADMVQTQHALVRRALRIEKLHAVMGISMGGMQVFEWAVTYPKMLERAVAIVGSPRLAPYDLQLWQAELDAIFADAEWKGGDYARQPVLSALQEIHELALTTPEHFNRANARAAQPARAGKRGAPAFDACDRVRQLQAMMSHDVSAPFGGSLARAAAVATVPLLVIVAARDHMVTPGPALEMAAAAPRARVLKLDSECGHLVPGCEPEKISTAVAEFLK